MKIRRLQHIRPADHPGSAPPESVRDGSVKLPPLNGDGLRDALLSLVVIGDLGGWMARSRRKKRPINHTSATEPHKSLNKSPTQNSQPEPEHHYSRPHRLRSRIASANKVVLTAVTAGIVSAITAGVVALPHLISSAVRGSPPPLTIAGPAPSANSENGAGVPAPCILGSVFLRSGMVDPPSPMSTRQVISLMNNPENIDVGIYRWHLYPPGQSEPTCGNYRPARDCAAACACTACYRS